MKQGAVQVQHCVNTHRPTQTHTRGLSDYNCMGPEAFSFPCAMDGACWPFSIFFLFFDLNFDWHISTKMTLFFKIF